MRRYEFHLSAWGGPASCEEAAKRCTALNWTVGPTLIKGELTMKQLLFVFALCALLAVVAFGFQAQNQPAQPGQIMQMAPSAGAPVQAQSACGNQPLCYDTQDFTATITSFLTSTNSSNYKILDVALRFQPDQRLTHEPASLE